MGAGGAGSLAGGGGPGSLPLWRPPTASTAPATRKGGAASGRGTTRPSAPPTGRQHATAHHSPADHTSAEPPGLTSDTPRAAYLLLVVELRRLQVTTVAGLDFPHATQAIRITRRIRPLRSRRWRTVRVYGSPTSPPPRLTLPAWPTGSGDTGVSRRCTTSAMSPSPRTPRLSRPTGLGHGHRPTAAR